MSGVDEEEMEQETRNEEKMDSDDSSDGSDDEEELNQGEIAKLQQQIEENPYNYDSHVKLIGLLKGGTDFNKIRAARESMSKVFPLTPELWLEWLADEIKYEDSREKVYQLFDRAVQDYTSIDVWIEYIQYSVGDIAKEGGLQKIRDIAERALTAVGKHVAEGSLVWAAYRELENAVLAGLQPAPGSVPSAQLVEQQQAQTKRLHTLFKRQLNVPLLEMESTMNEYREWSDEEMDAHVQQAYDKALKELQVLLPFEQQLLSEEINKLEAYKKYLKHEMKENNDPSRTQCLFERAIVDNCLESQVWENYGKYLYEVLHNARGAASVYERAIRNCPWQVTLWLRYCRALEKSCPDDHDKISGVFEKALLTNVFSQSNDLVQMWTGYIDYMRRRVDFTAEPGKNLEDLRVTFERAIEFMDQNYGNEGDPTCSIHQYWARIEAKFCKNMEKARLLWTEIMQRGFGNQAQMWLEYFNLERAHGDQKHCRKLLGRALNSVTDWPEYIVDAYIMYEREEGTLEQLDDAMKKCDAQMKRIGERKAAELEERKIKRRLNRGFQKPATPKRCKVCHEIGHTTLAEGLCAERLKIPLDNVTPFKGKFDILSNFYPCKVRVFDQEFGSSEHAYQYKKAVKCGDIDMAYGILRLACPREVKILSKGLKTDSEWKETKLDLMREIIRAKAECVPEYREALLNARDIIAEAVPDDKYWSCGLSKDEVIWAEPTKWPGENMMGKLHMELREELLSGKSTFNLVKETEQKKSASSHKTIQEAKEKESKEKTKDRNSNRRKSIDSAFKDIPDEDKNVKKTSPKSKEKEKSKTSNSSKVKLKRGRSDEKDRRQEVKCENEAKIEKEAKERKKSRDSRSKSPKRKTHRRNKSKKQRRHSSPKVKISHLELEEEEEETKSIRETIDKNEKDKKIDKVIEQSTAEGNAADMKFDFENKTPKFEMLQTQGFDVKNIHLETSESMEISQGLENSESFEEDDLRCQCYGVEFLNTILSRFENSTLMKLMNKVDKITSESTQKIDMIMGSRRKKKIGIIFLDTIANKKNQVSNLMHLEIHKLESRKRNFINFLAQTSITEEIEAAVKLILKTAEEEKRKKKTEESGKEKEGEKSKSRKIKIKRPTLKASPLYATSANIFQQPPFPESGEDSEKGGKTAKENKKQGDATEKRDSLVKTGVSVEVSRKIETILSPDRNVFHTQDSSKERPRGKTAVIKSRKIKIENIKREIINSESSDNSLLALNLSGFNERRSSPPEPKTIKSEIIPQSEKEPISGDRRTVTSSKTGSDIKPEVKPSVSSAKEVESNFDIESIPLPPTKEKISKRSTEQDKKKEKLQKKNKKSRKQSCSEDSEREEEKRMKKKEKNEKSNAKTKKRHKRKRSTGSSVSANSNTPRSYRNDDVQHKYPDRDDVTRKYPESDDAERIKSDESADKKVRRKINRDDRSRSKKSRDHRSSSRSPSAERTSRGREIVKSPKKSSRDQSSSSTSCDDRSESKKSRNQRSRSTSEERKRGREKVKPPKKSSRDQRSRSPSADRTSRGRNKVKPPRKSSRDESPRSPSADRTSPEREKVKPTRKYSRDQRSPSTNSRRDKVKPQKKRSRLLSVERTSRGGEKSRKKISRDQSLRSPSTERSRSPSVDDKVRRDRMKLARSSRSDSSDIQKLKSEGKKKETRKSRETHVEDLRSKLLRKRYDEDASSRETKASGRDGSSRERMKTSDRDGSSRERVKTSDRDGSLRERLKTSDHDSRERIQAKSSDRDSQTKRKQKRESSLPKQYRDPSSSSTSSSSDSSDSEDGELRSSVERSRRSRRDSRSQERRTSSRYERSRKRENSPKGDTSKKRENSPKMDTSRKREKSPKSDTSSGTDTSLEDGWKELEKTKSEKLRSSSRDMGRSRTKSDIKSRLGARESGQSGSSSRSHSFERPRFDTKYSHTPDPRPHSHFERPPWSDNRFDRQPPRLSDGRGLKRPFDSQSSDQFYSPLSKRSRLFQEYACLVCKTSEHTTLDNDCPARIETPHNNVTAFKGKNNVFSNFYPCKIKYNNKDFKSSEHAYQYMKCVICNRQDLAEQILQTEYGLDVKQLVKGIYLTPEWHRRKEDIMFEIIVAKATDCEEYMYSLLNSKELIVEAVPFDKYWSAGLAEEHLVYTKREFWPGQNRMGHLHMKLRDELKK